MFETSKMSREEQWEKAVGEFDTDELIDEEDDPHGAALAAKFFQLAFSMSGFET